MVIQRTVAEGIADRLGEDLTGDPIRVSFHEVPLVPFINEVFGEELGMSFAISPGLREKTDLVTLKLTEPLPPRQLFATARRVLREYGVDVREVEEGILSFAPSQDIASRDVPLLVSGRTLPEVPATHRTIFQLVPLKVVRGPQVRGWLKEAFERRDLKILEDPERNALLLKGNVDMIARALAMIEVLDQPLLRGRHGLIIEPVFMQANDLAGALNWVLRAEGYASSVGAGVGSSVILLALESVNKVIVFAVDEGTVDHVEEWAVALDANRMQSIEEAVFTYEVRNTQAEELVETLNQVLGAGVGAAPSRKPREAGNEGGVSRENDGQSRRETGQSAPAGRAGGRIVVDKNSNMLLFRGSGKEWAEIRSVIQRLDRAVPSVLIEVLIAEVTLTDEEQTGFEFLIRGALGSRGLTANTFGVGGVVSFGGLDSAGDTRAVLNLFYKDDRVVIRSRPRLLVKSGETASIDVGNEIPVITRKTDSDQSVDGTSNVLQEISYRKTGVQLEIKPLVQANGLVDLAISQQLSEARSTGTDDRPHSHHPEPPDQHQPHPARRRLAPDGRPYLRQPERGHERRAGAGPAPGAGAPVPHRHRSGGSHGADDHGHPLRHRRPRGRVGAHPEDSRAARAAHRDRAVMRFGTRVRCSGTGGHGWIEPPSPEQWSRVNMGVPETSARQARPSVRFRLGPHGLASVGPDRRVSRRLAERALPMGVAISSDAWIIPPYAGG